MSQDKRKKGGSDFSSEPPELEKKGLSDESSDKAEGESDAEIEIKRLSKRPSIEPELEVGALDGSGLKDLFPPETKASPQGVFAGRKIAADQPPPKAASVPEPGAKKEADDFWLADVGSAEDKELFPADTEQQLEKDFLDLIQNVAPEPAKRVSRPPRAKSRSIPPRAPKAKPEDELKNLLKEIEDEDEKFYAQFEAAGKAKQPATEAAAEPDAALAAPPAEPSADREAAQSATSGVLRFQKAGAGGMETGTPATSGMVSLPEPSPAPPPLQEPLEEEPFPEVALGEGTEPVSGEPPAEISDALSILEKDLVQATAAAKLEESAGRLFAQVLSGEPDLRDKASVAAQRAFAKRAEAGEQTRLVGSGAEVERTRGDLLEHLAERAEGANRARLLAAAAEIRKRHGEPERALSLYESALEADPQDPISLREARREAVAAEQLDKAAELLRAEASLPITPQERSLILTGLAEMLFRRMGDAKAAQEAAGAAIEADSANFTAGLLSAEICLAQDRPKDAIEELRQTAGRWSDPAGRGALLAEAGRRLEQTGEVEQAEFLFRQAVEADPKSLDALLGLARAARRSKDFDGAINALVGLSELVEQALLKEELLRTAARYALFPAGRPQQAVELLAQDSGAWGLRLRARAAEAAGDHGAWQAALQAWAQASEGTERALALVESAQLYASLKDANSALDELQKAAAADGRLDTIRVVREIIARETGDALQLARAVEEENQSSALMAAAKLAKSGAAQAEQERLLLERAVSQGEAALTAETLALDAAASAGDQKTVQEALLRETERLGSQERIGPLLALLDFGPRALSGETYAQIAQEARAALPGSPLVLRQLAREAEDHVKAAEYWLDEAAAAEGLQAAFASTQAGRRLEAAGQDPTNAYRDALEAAPGYEPACWALETYARAKGDLDSLQLAHQQLAESSDDRAERCARLARSALIKIEGDRPGAAALVQQALQIDPHDAILNDLMFRLAENVPVDYLAKQIEENVEGLSPASARAALLKAASAYRDAGDPTRAAEIYRRVTKSGEKPDPLTEWELEKAETAAGLFTYVSDRILDQIRLAQDNETRAAAFQRLAEFEEARGDRSSSVVALESLLQSAPGNIVTLRRLQRYFLEQKRDDDLLRIIEALVEHLKDPADVTAYLRLTVRLRESPREAVVAASDPLIIKSIGRAEPDLWLIQRMEAAARRAGDPQLVARVLSDLEARFADPMERASIALRAAEALESSALDQAAAAANRAVEAAPDHPSAAEELGRLREALNDHAGAAQAYETAARFASDPDRIKRLWQRAGVIWQDEVKETERALAALNSVVNLDVLYRDAFTRARKLLVDKGDKAGLKNLLQARLRSEGEASELCELNRELAWLCVESNDRVGAKSALRAALELEPQNVQGLHALGEMHLEDQEWSEASDVLIRLAGLTKDPEELCWLFFQLGDIYDRHLPNLERAEIAFSRVVKLRDNHMEAIERLADVYLRQKQPGKAIRALQRLIQLTKDNQNWQRYMLQIAGALEQLGQPRDAEKALELCRQKRPTDLTVIHALADYYRRQKAESALAMHLDRSANEFRGAVLSDAARPEYWLGLVEVLTERKNTHAAQACASTAHALGISDPKLAALVDARGATPLRTKAVNDPRIDAIVAPAGLSDTTRLVLQGAAPGLDKALPFDPKWHGAERLKTAPKPLERILAAVAQWFGIAEIVLYTNRSRLCLPVSNDPFAILIGEPLIEQTDDAEKLFLLTRAAKIGAANLTPIVRSQRHELLVAINALVRHFDRAFEPRGANLDALDEMARRIGKAIPRKYHDELAPSVFEMKGMPEFDPNRLPEAVYSFGSRVALVAIGSTEAAVNALLKLSAAQPKISNPHDKFAAIRRNPEASALFEFSISDLLFTARQKAAGTEK